VRGVRQEVVVDLPLGREVPLEVRQDALARRNEGGDLRRGRDGGAQGHEPGLDLRDSPLQLAHGGKQRVRDSDRAAADECAQVVEHTDLATGVGHGDRPRPWVRRRDRGAGRGRIGRGRRRSGSENSRQKRRRG
jgi:hypothetical protein